MQVRKQQLELDMEQQIGSKYEKMPGSPTHFDKRYQQGCILSPCLFNLYAEYIMANVALDEAQAGIKFQGEISSTSDMQMKPPLWQKVKRN